SRVPWSSIWNAIFLLRIGRRACELPRHCERSEAIPPTRLLRFARNDKYARNDEYTRDKYTRNDDSDDSIVSFLITYKKIK
ncbi:MAG TPA: hypothetical protein VJL87_00905, partial [Bdellovibrionota bacterium]|nr:hypothetical protein [Bdellovibrionota bacterium]